MDPVCTVGHGYYIQFPWRLWRELPPQSPETFLWLNIFGYSDYLMLDMLIRYRHANGAQLLPDLESL